MQAHSEEYVNIDYKVIRNCIALESPTMTSQDLELIDVEYIHTTTYIIVNYSVQQMFHTNLYIMSRPKGKYVIQLPEALFLLYQ